jgi:hypothetical protein
VTNVVVLNSQVHAKLRVHAQPSATLGDNQRFVAIVAGEFAVAALHYPLFFSKDADTGRFYCGAMLGFDANENLLLEEQRGQKIYRPLNLQRGPFYTSGADLAIDLEHARVASSGETALFDERGEASAYLKSVIDLMNDLKIGAERTKQFIDGLLQLKLIEPLSLNVNFDDGSRREITGLYTVNHDGLKALPDAQVLDLFRRGYLQLIYLQLASLSHVSTLARKKNLGFLGGDPSRPPRT